MSVPRKTFLTHFCQNANDEVAQNHFKNEKQGRRKLKPIFLGEKSSTKKWLQAKIYIKMGQEHTYKKECKFGIFTLFPRGSIFQINVAAMLQKLGLVQITISKVFEQNRLTLNETKLA